MPRGPHPFERRSLYRRLSSVDVERDAERMPELELTRADTCCGRIDRRAARSPPPYAPSPRPAGTGEAPIVVHCHAGIDRTGVLLGRLLDLVGAERSAIAADCSDSAVARGQSTGVGPASPILPETMVESLQHVDTRHGGVRRYLLDRGISTRVVDAIRRMQVGSPGQEGALSDDV